MRSPISGGDSTPPSGSETAAQHYETGTTVVTLRGDGGAVMAADRRVSLGGRFVASKNARKIEVVHPTAVVGIAGSVGPAQAFVASLRSEASLYQVRRGEPMSPGALAQTAGHLARGRPIQPLLAVVDDSGGHVYELDGSGSVLEDDHAASGSGMQVAYGVLEGHDGGRALEELRATAVGAVRAASERDTASGNGVTVATITDDGVEVEGGGGESAEMASAREPGGGE